MNKLMILWGLIPTFLSTPLTPSLSADKPFLTSVYYDKNKELDFTDSTQQEIDDYYGDIQKKKGDELLNYLYQKISVHNADTEEGKQYFTTYDETGKWYEITDRNWTISEEISPETFTFSTIASDNYFLYNAYISDSANNDKTKAFNNKINSGFESDESAKKIDYVNKKKPKNVQVDKEHMWAKNHGFKLKKGNADVFAKGAPTDLHHLLAADHNTNSAGHNDHFFGNVDHSTSKEILNYLADGTSEVSGWLDAANDTFEPTDEWKGDVARCLFYMATRYSQKLEKNTQAEPYLFLTDDRDYKDDDANHSAEEKNFHGVQYNLSTLLEWNEKDPVSEYEKHRNNLIYKNVQDNRNPYIDHPEWARRVFDDSYSVETDFSSFDGKTFEGHLGDEYILPLQFESDDVEYQAVYDSDFLSLDGNKVTFKKTGKTTLGFVNPETEKKYSCEFDILDKISVDDFKCTSSSDDNFKEENENVSIDEGGKFQIDVKASSLSKNEKIVYRSSDDAIASIDENGLVTAKKAGTVSIDVLVENDTDVKLENRKVLKSFKLTINQRDFLSFHFPNLSRKASIAILIAILVILLIIIIILIVVFVRNADKKTKKKLKKEMKKIAGKNTSKSKKKKK